MHVAAGHPSTETDYFPGVMRGDLVVDLRQIEYVLDAVVAVVGVEWPEAEELLLSLRPHLMEAVLVLVYAVTCLVTLQDLVQAYRPDVAALLDHILSPA